MTDSTQEREAWEAIHRRMLTNASLATSKALEGLILQSADETGDLISTLESDLARVTRERDELVRQAILDEARIERDRHRVQEVRELRAALTEAVIEGEKVSFDGNWAKVSKIEKVQHE